MAKDAEEEEREFLADLQARTGRSLADWMAAITAQGFADKNHAIDWLRAQGFPFARASWLERIHSNGGRPIYGDPPAAAEPRAGIDPRPKTPAKPAAPPPRAPTRASQEALEKLVATAKGYRPLYHMLEAQIRQAVPVAVFEAKAGYISVGAPREFAAVIPHASELRLGLDLGEHPFDARVQKARLKSAPAAISHMLVLTDARQLNADLTALIIAAHTRVNG
jgi:hypothetical protein